MSYLRELLREHQAATDTSDDELVGIIADFIVELYSKPITVVKEPLDPKEVEQLLIDYIVGRLERIPRDFS